MIAKTVLRELETRAKKKIEMMKCFSGTKTELRRLEKLNLKLGRDFLNIIFEFTTLSNIFPCKF